MTEVSLWTHVTMTKTCWLFGSNAGSYGGGAHRFSWTLHNGPIPAGMHVLHYCDTPACVRPDHLFLGTHRDNMRDAASKGRLNATYYPTMRNLRRLEKLTKMMQKNRKRAA